MSQAVSEAVKFFVERVQLYKEAAKHRKTHRVLNLSIALTPLMIYDSGYRLYDGLTNYDVLIQAVRKFHEKYQFDGYLDFGFRNPIRIGIALGSLDYFVDEDDVVVEYHSDVSYMEEEDYDLMIKDYYRFLWTRVMPRKFPKLRGPHAKKRIIIGVKEYLKYIEFYTKIVNVLIQEYGVLPILAVPQAAIPFETLYLSYRGAKKLAMDLRRMPDKVKEAMDVLWCIQLEKLKQVLQTPGTTTYNGPDIFTAMLGHNILSTKQFEEFYWPYLKELIDLASRHDKIIHIFAESENSRFYQFFKEVPRGHVVIHFEMDNVFKAKEELGERVCLVGGMPISLLKHGTKEECVRYAKKLIDELASDGGYIFSTDKLVSYPHDYKPENLLAVNQFIRNYRL
ncbi:MAG: hypothetical protein N3E36_04270 [Sulfolobales archaeon]|nr:hypothetical protein [Sulfolobales archaeon]